MRVTVLVFLCASVGLFACSDEKPGPLADLGASDGPVAPASCLTRCTKEALYLCVKDTAGACVECSSDGHCKQNPGALGPSCVTASGVCACSAHSDCKDRSSGQYCHATSRICGCLEDTDCPSSTRCLGKLFGVGVCRAPCASKADCPAKDAPVCDTKSGKCLACAADSDCAGQNVWGNRCMTSAGAPACLCKTSTDCKGNKNGPTCAAAFNKCTCTVDADCKTAAYGKCTLPYSGAAYKHCQKPCTVDSDCGSGLRCSVSSGRCGECANDADCRSASLGHCDTAWATCVACKLDAHCPGSAPHCHATSGKCTRCLTDSHCKADLNWGSRCLSSSSAGKLCRCKSSTDCKGNHNGPTCYAKYAKCSCKTDADCKASPYVACRVPYADATYKNCQKKCSSHNHCTSSAAPYCDVTSGACVGCTSETHCERGALPLCDTKTGKCAKCKAQKDCAGSLLGSHCDTKTGACTCATDAHCKGRAWGGECDTKKYKRCICSADSDCAGNANGPTCNTKQKACGCVAGADCKTAPYTQCFAASAGSSLSHCQTACKGDSDCVVPGTGSCLKTKSQCVGCQTDGDCGSSVYRYCVAKTGLCIQCRSQKDCGGAAYQLCAAKTGRCVWCLTSADCAKNRWARTCDTGGSCVECNETAKCSLSSLGNLCSKKRCVCKADTDCKANKNGARCLSSVGACGCVADGDCPEGKKCAGHTGFSKHCK